MSRNIKDIRIARTPTLPIDPFQTYLEVHQDNLASGLKSTGVSSNEILSSGPGTVTVTDNYEALVTDMIIYANMTNKSVTMNASKQIGSSVKIWKISDYDGDPVTVLPGSGITIEGLSELKLYVKYSFVELERISATVFAIKDLQDTHPLGVEQITNEKWVDGKRIYQKIIDIGALPNATTKNVTHGITGVSTVVLCKARAFSSGSTIVFEYASGTSPNIYFSPTALVIYCPTDRSAWVGTAIVKYTKT